MKPREINSSVINSSLEQKDVDKEAFLQMLADENIRTLYRLIAEQPRIASELRHITEIPPTTLYRNLTWLLEKGLVRGKQYRQKCYMKVMFYPVIASALITFERGNVKVITKLEPEQ